MNGKQNLTQMNIKISNLSDRLQLYQSINLVDMLKATDTFRKTKDKPQQLSGNSTELNEKEDNEYQSIVQLNHEKTKEEHRSQYTKLSTTGLEEDTLNQLSEIISYNVTDNESNNNNEHNETISDHTDKELEKGEIFDHLARRQNQNMTHSDKYVEKQKANKSREISDNKNTKDDIVSNNNSREGKLSSPKPMTAEKEII